MSTLAIIINKHTQVPGFNYSFKCWVLDAKKEFNTWDFIQRNTVQSIVQLRY